MKHVLSTSALLLTALLLAPASWAQDRLPQGGGGGHDPGADFADPPDAARGGGGFVTQLPDQFDTWFSDKTCDSVNCTSTDEQALAEDFVVLDPVTVTDVTVWAGYFPSSEPRPDNFGVLIHLDNGGLPGGMVYGRANLRPACREATGNTIPSSEGDLSEFVYRIDLPNPVNLLPGTYWIQVVNDIGGGVDWGWETSGGHDPATGRAGSARAFEAPGGTWFNFFPDLAFSLNAGETYCGGAPPACPPFNSQIQNRTTEPTFNGDLIRFRLLAQNNGAEPGGIRLRLEAYSPTGNFLLERSTAFNSLNPGQVKAIPMSFRIPQGTPAGEYGMRLFAENQCGEVVNQVTYFITHAGAPLAATSAVAATGAYPNPFRDATQIRFTLAERTDVTLAVYDVTGREVARLVSGPLEAGDHTATFDALVLPSGVYVYRLVTGREVETGRLTLLQ